VVTFIQAQTQAFPLCTSEEMKHRLEELDIDEKLRTQITSYLLKYADSQKAASGVSSVIRGMLHLIAPNVTDAEYKQIYERRAAFIRAVVKGWDDAETTIAYWDGSIQP